MLCVIKCVSDALLVCGSSPKIHVAQILQTKTTKKTIWVVFLLNSGARVVQHLPVSLREGTLPSRHPITATSLTAAVVVNKLQASLVLQHYRCKATRARNTDDAQTASHSSRSRQATPLRVGADSAADADLWLFITLDCAPPSFFSSTSLPSLPCFSLLLILG